MNSLTHMPRLTSSLASYLANSEKLTAIAKPLGMSAGKLHRLMKRLNLK
ncbi:hypothetical protein AB4140_00160 [Shewanella sp. 10N.286.51.B2]